MADDVAVVRRLDPAEAREHLDALAAVVADCVAGGASVSYLAPFSLDDARAAVEPMVADAERGGRVLLGAFLDGELVGTVQVLLTFPPNQPHRGEIAKMLVHRSARNRGIGQLLMEHAEEAARAEGKTLLVLDTANGTAARLYERCGWIKVGEVPGFALYPDGTPCATVFYYKEL
ncbi:MAG TPA: GNAT family N-acetyltransferase [Gaiellaceae bacterium]|nr:GNAT family N-acetyltransferase [Gaiellaceae bacterium]